jgi:hypothetical protein
MNLAFWKAKLCYCMLYTSPGIFLLENIVITWFNYCCCSGSILILTQGCNFFPSLCLMVIGTAVDKDGTGNNSATFLAVENPSHFH